MFVCLFVFFLEKCLATADIKFHENYYGIIARSLSLHHFGVILPFKKSNHGRSKANLVQAHLPRLRYEVRSIKSTSFSITTTILGRVTLGEEVEESIEG